MYLGAVKAIKSGHREFSPDYDAHPTPGWLLDRTWPKALSEDWLDVRRASESHKGTNWYDPTGGVIRLSEELSHFAAIDAHWKTNEFADEDVRAFVFELKSISQAKSSDIRTAHRIRLRNMAIKVGFSMGSIHERDFNRIFVEMSARMIETMGSASPRLILYCCFKIFELYNSMIFKTVRTDYIRAVTEHQYSKGYDQYEDDDMVNVPGLSVVNWLTNCTDGHTELMPIMTHNRLAILIKTLPRDYTDIEKGDTRVGSWELYNDMRTHDENTLNESELAYSRWAYRDQLTWNYDNDLCPDANDLPDNYVAIPATVRDAIVSIFKESAHVSKIFELLLSVKMRFALPPRLPLLRRMCLDLEEIGIETSPYKLAKIMAQYWGLKMNVETGIISYTDWILISLWREGSLPGPRVSPRSLARQFGMAPTETEMANLNDSMMNRLANAECLIVDKNRHMLGRLIERAPTIVRECITVTQARSKNFELALHIVETADILPRFRCDPHSCVRWEFIASNNPEEFVAWSFLELKLREAIESQHGEHILDEYSTKSIFPTLAIVVPSWVIPDYINPEQGCANALSTTAANMTMAEAWSRGYGYSEGLTEAEEDLPENEVMGRVSIWTAIWYSSGTWRRMTRGDFLGQTHNSCTDKAMMTWERALSQRAGDQLTVDALGDLISDREPRTGRLGVSRRRYEVWHDPLIMIDQDCPPGTETRLRALYGELVAPCYSDELAMRSREATLRLRNLGPRFESLTLSMMCLQLNIHSCRVFRLLENRGGFLEHWAPYCCMMRNLNPYALAISKYVRNNTKGVSPRTLTACGISIRAKRRDSLFLIYTSVNESVMPLCRIDLLDSIIENVPYFHIERYHSADGYAASPSVDLHRSIGISNRNKEVLVKYPANGMRGSFKLSVNPGVIQQGHKTERFKRRLGQNIDIIEMPVAFVAILRSIRKRRRLEAHKQAIVNTKTPEEEGYCDGRRIEIILADHVSKYVGSVGSKMLPDTAWGRLEPVASKLAIRETEDRSRKLRCWASASKVGFVVVFKTEQKD
jgi:transposase